MEPDDVFIGYRQTFCRVRSAARPATAEAFMTSTINATRASRSGIATGGYIMYGSVLYAFEWALPMNAYPIMATPKGDGPGFVAIEDERTLLIPERKGNKLIQGLQNILATGRVALVFLVPGTEETLRVHGRAELTADPAVLARLEERGQPALLAIRVHVEQVFFHCAKAFKRSKLWQPDTWPEKLRISFGTMLAKRLGAGADAAQKIDAAVEEDYRTGL